jgi:hypothetical protein
MHCGTRSKHGGVSGDYRQYYFCEKKGSKWDNENITGNSDKDNKHETTVTEQQKAKVSGGQSRHGVLSVFAFSYQNIESLTS